MANVQRIIPAVVIFVAAGASLVQADEAAQGIEFFEKRIRPLLAARCYECHGAKEQESQLRLDRYAFILTGGTAGPAIVPGKPQRSLLITAVSYQSDDLQMPPEKRLADSQVADLRRWIEMGAPHPERDSALPSLVKEEADGGTPSNFWAFQPPTKRQIPTAQDRLWPQTPVDRFVLARLEQANLKPRPPTDRRTLIRRATFDLTGLPPTPQVTAAFLADASPDAFAKVVDRLLASPQYGERWGRHWLDVARYADSNGLDENVAHGNAWRYRDYVIGAWNRDKPYDRFVQEQLAGDLLPAAEPRLRNEQMIATGFLALGPKVLAEVDEQKMEMDIVDEQIDTVGKAFLGLTLGCARCHDHKFDPITTKDYYALAGIFKSTRTMEHFKKIARWHENPLHSPQYEEQEQQHQQQLAAAKETLAKAVEAANEQLRSDLGAGAQFPTNPEPSYPVNTRDSLKKLRDRLAQLEKNPPSPPTAMGVHDGQVADTSVHIRGSHLTLGERVPRRFPSVLVQDKQPLGSGQSGRLELAHWLTSDEHPLTARVMVNRIWRWHFGRGLVDTPDNFGRLGNRPANEPLLDWLAVRFVESGWSIKAMHRLILLSSTYQMDSRGDELAARIDPENRLRWRMNIRRLEAEEIRDAMLAVGGTLDPAMGGSLLGAENRKHIFDHTSKDETSYGSRRRSVYLPVVRNHLYDAFSLFDYADASMPSGNRNTSTVAPQALYMMNSEFVAEMAANLAGRLLQNDLDDAGRVQLLYELTVNRPADEEEAARMLQFLKRAQQQLAGGNEDENRRYMRAWQLACHAILSSSEFIYLR